LAGIVLKDNCRVGGLPQESGHNYTDDKSMAGTGNARGIGKQRVPGPVLTPLACAVALAFASPVQANPTGAQVAAGAASFQTSGKTLTVTNTPGTILNWSSFSIAPGEITRFQQQSALSAVLNRVTGGNPSSILGTLSSNGRVFLVNPHGIVFGQGSVINTAGFVASTLNISDADFLSGRMKFEGGGNGVLRNEGVIQAAGDIFLVGPQIENAGLIRSETGSVLLAAGQSVTITSPDAQGVQFALQAPTDSALNLGVIEAKNAAGMFAGTLKHSGDIRVTSASVDASGRVTLAAQKDAILDGNATINVDSSAGKGGSVQITGERVGLFDNATVTARGAAGGGEILVGGDYKGGNPKVRNAEMTHVSPMATLDASATVAGDGGRIILWADDVTRVHGNVFARGGPQGGAGGFIETSGKRFLDVAGIKLSASGDVAGQWLLDPYNVTVVAGAGTSNNGGGPGFVASGDDSQIGADLIVTQLNSGTGVTISTFGAGTQAGNITIDAPIVKTANNSAGMILNADGDITVNQNIDLGPSTLAGFSALAGGVFNINNATVSAMNISVTADTIQRSGAQANDFIYSQSTTQGIMRLTTNTGALGSVVNPIRFSSKIGFHDSIFDTSAAGAAGDVYLDYTGASTNFFRWFPSTVATDAATTQTVSLANSLPANGDIEMYGAITGNDHWIINTGGNLNISYGATLTGHSITGNISREIGYINTGGNTTAPLAFDTSAVNGPITLTATTFTGTGCGGNNWGVGVAPGSGIVTATSVANPAICGGNTGSLQFRHFGGDLLSSRYNLSFTGVAAGSAVRLWANDGHIIFDSTAGFDASLNNKNWDVRTVTAGKDIRFAGGTITGGQVNLFSAANIDNLAPGTDGFVQNNAISPQWMLVAGGGIGLTNPVEGAANWVGSAVTGAAGAAGNINIKFTGGSPRFGEIRTQAGSVQNIDIESTVGLIFSTGQPGFGGVLGGGSISDTANDQYIINAAGSIFFDNFNNSFTADTITMTSGGGIVHGVSGGGDMMSTTGLLTMNANGGSIGGAGNSARLRGSGARSLYARDNIYIDAGANPLTLAGLTTGAGAGTISLTTTAANDLSLGGTTNIDDALVLNIGGNILFPAAASFTTSGGLGLNSPTQIASTASVNVTGGTFTATQPVTNAGTLSTGIAGATTLAAAFHNSGTLDVNAGTVNLAGGGTSTGAFDAAPGATINFSGGTHDLGDGSTLTGGGTIGYTGGTLNLNGGGAGTTVVAGTTLAATGQTFGGVGKLVNLGTFNLANSTVSGDLDNQGTLNASGASAVNGALVLSTGTLNLVAGGTLTKGGGATDWIGGAITGTGTYTGGLTFTGGGARVLNGPTLNLGVATLSGGSLLLQSGTLNFGGIATIAPSATLEVTGGTVTGALAVDVQGLLKMNGGVLNAASLGLVPGGVLSGNGGTINAPVVNGGTVAVGASPGTLVINGNYAQTPTGVLNVELGGLTQGIDYDLLQVTGTAALDGTLNVALFGGFTGAAGNVFDVLTYGSRTGDFATVNFPAGYTMTATPNAAFYQLAINSITAPPVVPPVVPPSSGGDADVQILLPASEVKILNDKFLATVDSGKQPEEEEKKGAVLECK
jgi:filamentous hemagglutinin family protein